MLFKGRGRKEGRGKFLKGGVRSFTRRPITIVINFIDFLKNLYSLIMNINRRVILAPKVVKIFGFVR